MLLSYPTYYLTLIYSTQGSADFFLVLLKSKVVIKLNLKARDNYINPDINPEPKYALSQ